MPAILSKNLNSKGSGLVNGTPYDSGNIVVIARAGSPPIKQVDGTQQSATKLTCSQVAGEQGNYVGPGTPNVFKSPAPITNIALTSNVLTVTCVNAFVVGQNVEFSGLTTATFLNRTDVVVVSASPTQFTAALTRANYVSAADTGTATMTYASRAAGLSLYAGRQ